MTDGVELNDRLESLIFQKMGKIDQYLKNFAPDAKEATIRIEKGTNWGYVASFDMYLPGKEHVFAEEKGKQIPQTLTALQESVERQIKTYKGKLQDYS